MSSDAVAALALAIRVTGPVLAVKVSAAGRGRYGKGQKSWRVMRYVIVLRKSDGRPTAKVESAAGVRSSSLGAARRRADALCVAEGRVSIDKVGPVSEDVASRALALLCRRVM